MTNPGKTGSLARRDALLLMASAAAMPMFAGPAFAADSKPMRGVMPIVMTPYTPAGEIDWEDLARQMVFYDRCGLQGAIWPQNSSDVGFLSKAERMKGMEVIATACRPLKVASILGVQGTTTAEMLEYARHAETLAPDAMIAMPPSAEQSVEGYHAYFAALAGVTKRPVIMQTSLEAGTANPLVPSTDLIIQLAREFPNFGYVKEESQPRVQRMRTEIKARPIMKEVYGAGGDPWLFELRLGSDGEQTVLGAYADVMEKVWQFYQAGKTAQAADAYAKLLLMKNCEAEIHGTQRYIFKKRGVFKSTAERRGPGAGTVNIPNLDSDQIAEIEMRFATLKPLLVVA